MYRISIFKAKVEDNVIISVASFHLKITLLDTTESYDHIIEIKLYIMTTDFPIGHAIQLNY